MLKAEVVTRVPKASLEDADDFALLGTATAHEACGREGFLGADLRPIYAGARIAGPAVTVLCPPGDNLMIHAAVEQCAPGDILVVTTTSPSSDGFVGELLATALKHRGVRGLVTTTGVRDVADLTGMSFPIWSRYVSAQGTVKATAGCVNTPISIGGSTINPGDIIVADDDGVQRVPRLQVQPILASAKRRSETEAHSRAAYQAGALSLDSGNLRSLLEDLGVSYVKADGGTSA